MILIYLINNLIMKQILLTCFLSTLLLLSIYDDLIAQSHVLPFEVGSKWEVQFNSKNSNNCFNLKSLGEIIIKRDTMINNLDYHIIGWPGTNNDYAIREDSEKRVWIIYLNRLIGYSTNNDSVFIEDTQTWFYRLGDDSTEYLLYDFNIESQDTVLIYIPPFSYSSYGAFAPKIGGYCKFYCYWRGTYDYVNCETNELRNCLDFYCIENIPGGSGSDYYDIQFGSWVEGLGAIRGGPLYTETFAFFENIPIIIDAVYDNGQKIYPCNSSINDVAKKKSIIVFPNPTSEILNIRSKSVISAIVILDIAGNEVCSWKNINSNSFESYIGNITNGVYNVKIIDSNNLSIHQKLLIEK